MCARFANGETAVRTVAEGATASAVAEALGFAAGLIHRG